MKNKYIILIIVLVVIFLLTTVLLCTKLLKKTEIKNIKSFSFSYSTGYAMYSNVIYSLKKDKNKILVSIKPDGISDEEKLEAEVDSSFLASLESILNEYNVGNWNGFDKIDKYVLDGNSFSLSIMMENDKSISAHGYMRWPKNYTEVKNKLNNLFMEVYNNKLGNQ